MTSTTFKVGDTVHCKREENDQWYGFDFVGEVTEVLNDGDEYIVSNHPPTVRLIWPEEMELVHE